VQVKLIQPYSLTQVFRRDGVLREKQHRPDASPWGMPAFLQLFPSLRPGPRILRAVLARVQLPAAVRLSEAALRAVHPSQLRDQARRRQNLWVGLIQRGLRCGRWGGVAKGCCGWALRQ
jgi:hypothetical protein